MFTKAVAPHLFRFLALQHLQPRLKLLPENYCDIVLITIGLVYSFSTWIITAIYLACRKEGSQTRPSAASPAGAIRVNNGGNVLLPQKKQHRGRGLSQTFLIVSNSLGSLQVAPTTT